MPPEAICQKSDHTFELLNTILLLEEAASKFGECGLDDWQEMLQEWADHLYAFH